ncbi:MAG: aminotransferase class III-fold pyridoxal phosphate-dependent enzyme [Desulfobulbaceae bacterium]|nr:aminotransferase class III-fold pyridoxal phosphate-dependent enzyme [Desulfobulbaceae bacterium]
MPQQERHILNEYNEYCKPKLSELLTCLKLDQQYIRAKDTYLYTDDGKKVTDFIGGFGAALLGHNHNELQDKIRQMLDKDVPIHTQVSFRRESAKLAKKISDLTPGTSEYLVNLSNSGTEAVEAALKHAYKVQFDKVRREYERLSRVLNDFYYRMQEEGEPHKLPAQKSLVDFRDDLDEYNLAQFEDFQNNPIVIALKGSFHGKTSGSLKVTFNKSYREPYEGLSAIKPQYVIPHRIERMAEILDESCCNFLYPIIHANEVELRSIKISKIIAFIFETIQGEGGMKPLPEKTLQYLADNHAQLGIPFILDEIQTGCGRTGSFYNYEQTPLNKISPEYIVLSKALGGGIVKIGATLIRRDIYDEDFGILHTSTFGEDDFSSAISLKAIEILHENNGQIMREVTQKGEYLLKLLTKLQSNYPNIIAEVRGKGLMIGIELTELKDFSPFFRASGKQGILSLLIASYLLNNHNIRTLAPLSTILKGNPGKKRLSVVRLQPPATITYNQIDHLIEALKEVCEVLNRNNEFCLISHLFGAKVPQKERRDPKSCPSVFPIKEEYRHIDTRTGFIVHPTTMLNLREYYFPSFAHYQVSDAALRDWWNAISRFLEPVHVKSEYVDSNDFVIENSLVFTPYLPEVLIEEKRPFRVQEIRDKIQDAVVIAKELGDDNIPVTMVGLGAYTSIATANGLTINDYEMSITTGNAYTTALMIQGIIKAAEMNNVCLPAATLAIIGASGNIGSITAKILAPRVAKLILVGSKRPGSHKRLELVRHSCLLEILKILQTGELEGADLDDLGALGEKIQLILKDSNTSCFKSFSQKLRRQHKLTDSDAKEFMLLLKKNEDNNILESILLTDDLRQIKDSDIVMVATNSNDEDLLQPDHLKPGTIICCASVPSNLSTELQAQPDNFLTFDGGLARLPDNSNINFVGMPKDGMCYGCMAETLLLGFDGHNHSFAKGTLTPEHIYTTIEMANMYGMELGPLKLGDTQVIP